MRRSITTFMAIAGLAVLSQTVLGQMRQTPYVTPPEPAGRYYNAAPVYQPSTAPHAAPAPQFRAASAPMQAMPAAYNGGAYSYNYNYQEPTPVAPVQPAPAHGPAAGGHHAGHQGGHHAGCSSCNGGCLSGGCSDCAHSGCNHCCEAKCCYGSCLHQSGGFAEFLYLSPRNVDLAYAVPQDGIGGLGTVPIGEVAVLDHDYSSGVRAGFTLASDCCSSFGASFTWYETQTDDFVSIDAPFVIQPMVTFPGTINAGSTAQQAAAVYSLDYQLVDVDYRAVLCKGPRYHINYVAGLRYAHIDQDFASTFPFSPPDGQVDVSTDINFDGFGVRLGLEGERRLFARSGLSVYSKVATSVLAGENRASYAQRNQFPGTVVFTAIEEDRVMTISELELGVSWTNCRGNLRLSGGFYFAAWDNLYTTPEYINAVQSSNFVIANAAQNQNYSDVSQDSKDSIAFDGFVGRVEYRF